MSLYGLMQQWPHRFNLSQTWFHGESFMDAPEPNADGLQVQGVTATDFPHAPDYHDADEYPTAVHLAALFLRWPDDPIWERYIWTRDRDRHGQRVYVGVNYGVFEIHRHIHITKRFAELKWA